jgi:hypothetical protein
MMPPGFIYFLYATGAIFYGLIGFLAHLIMDSELQWSDDDAFICALGWPITLAFWLLIGWPMMLIARLYKVFRSYADKISLRRKPMGEVK